MKESGYERQVRVESTFFRYEAILGGRLRARGSGDQVVEARTACNVLNRVLEVARPASYGIGA